MQSGSTPQADDKFKSISPPGADDLSYQIQQLVEQGVLSPEDAQAAMAGRSEMDNVSLDPKLQAAQMDALSSLKDISSSGGLTAMDKSNLNKVALDESVKAKGQRDAILQNAQARGMGGSGLELMAQLQNEQNAASNKSTRDLDIAGMAQQRALDALMQQGNLASSIQNQSFNQQASKANANDAIAKFNAQNQQAVNMANTQARNQAQEANLASKQNIANQNAGLQTQQNKQKADIAQQMFNNQITKAGGSQGVANQNAQAQGQTSQNAATANNQLIGGLLGAGASVYGAKGKAEGGLIEGEPADFDNQMTPTMSGEVVIRKEDVPELLTRAHTDEDGNFDAAGFLDTITGHKYGYSKKSKGA